MIQVKTIDGLMLRDMAMAGSAMLERHREMVDALNVFPVPDGDTGTNMSLTLQSAMKEVNSKEYLRADEAATALSKGALRGARGNSGVITSQLMRGFSRGLEGVEKITPLQFAQALQRGADMAYKAVMKPKEGTILTVARVVAEDAVRQAEAAPDDFDALFTTILKSGEEILRRTPEMLPALKEAGVVDAGGRGLMLIYAGYAAVLRGEDVASTIMEMGKDGAVPAEAEDMLDNLTFCYLTKFEIFNMNEDTTEGDVDSFRRRLNRIGDMVLVKGDLSGVTVQLRTNNPGNAVEFGLELGELKALSIENLLELKRERDGENTPGQPAQERKPFGMVTVSLGDGFSKIFKELGVDVVVEGGQTMNPSIEDIRLAIDQVHADMVFVFPNNGNVIMAAQQAAVEISDKQVHVLRTKNVAMGIAAAVAFQQEATPEENMTRMEAAAERVKTCTVTYAVRDSEVNGITIKQGNILALANGVVAQTGTDMGTVIHDLMAELVTDEDELITVYYGQDVAEADAHAMADEISRHFGHCDVECFRGGQPLYYYLISVE